MKTVAVLLFGAGVLLAVRVMFFGVQRALGDNAFATRVWPLSVASMLAVAGATLYGVSQLFGELSAGGVATVVAMSIFAALGARWTVQRSVAAAAESPDPGEDPRYRFQGQVARVIAAIGEPTSGPTAGRIAFVIDGRTLEFEARWLPGTTVSLRDGSVDSEVVIEHVDGALAFVEPWALVEDRL